MNVQEMDRMLTTIFGDISNLPHTDKFEDTPVHPLALAQQHINLAVLALRRYQSVTENFIDARQEVSRAALTLTEIGQWVRGDAPFSEESMRNMRTVNELLDGILNEALDPDGEGDALAGNPEETYNG